MTKSFFLFMLLVSFFCTNAYALSCIKPSIDEQIKSADDIFIGEVDEIISSKKIEKPRNWAPRHNAVAYLKVSKVLLGVERERQKVSFSFPVQKGEKYVIFDHDAITNGCRISLSRKVGKAGTFLKHIESTLDYDSLSKSKTTWSVKIDSCHRVNNNRRSKNKIFVDYWDYNGLVATVFKNGISDNCHSDGEDFPIIIGSNHSINKIFIRTKEVNPFIIDKLTLYKNGKKLKYYQTDNGEGWCLSRYDKYRKMEKAHKNAKCASRYQFNY